MINKTILIILILLISTFSFAQQKYVIKAIVIDKADDKPLDAVLYVSKNNERVAYTSNNRDGWIVIDSLLPGKYTLKAQYYYYSSTLVDVEIKDRNAYAEIYMSDNNLDSLLANYTLPKDPFYTLYNFGMMTEEAYNNIGRDNVISAKYNFKTVNMGCKILEPLIKLNKVKCNILDYINGSEWVDKYQAEIDSLNDKY
ncbi:MAG: hypothetical protein KAG84_05620 [Bacteroidales bacterium]|nr:hypothetical protein [Bacteroidales bacterium]